MKDIITQQMDETDFENASILTRIGDLKLGEGKILIGLSICGNLDIRDMVSVCKMRQPELSLSTRSLISRGYIKIFDVEKPEGKGRPKAVYGLTVPFTEIMNKIEEKQKAQIFEQKEKIERLKKLSV